MVSEETLHRTLATVPDPEDAVLQLVELAIRGGGPDNITCIVADVVDSATAPRQPGKPSVLAGAASNGGRPTIRTDSPAARAHLLSQTQPQAPIVVDHDDPAPRLRNGHDEEDTEPARRRWPIVRSLFVLLLVLIIGGGYLGWRYTQDQYYVGHRRRRGGHLPGSQPVRGRGRPVARVPADGHPAGRRVRPRTRGRSGRPCPPPAAAAR